MISLTIGPKDFEKIVSKIGSNYDRIGNFEGDDLAGTCLSIETDSSSAVTELMFELARTLAFEKGDSGTLHESDIDGIRDYMSDLTDQMRSTFNGETHVFYWPGIVTVDRFE